MKFTSVPAYDLGAASTSVTLYYSPDYFGADKAFCWDLGIETPLPKNITLAAHYGLTDYDNTSLGDNYEDWSLGLATMYSGFGLQLGYTDTSGVNDSCASHTCNGRVVLTVSRCQNA